ncbi:MAG: phosphate ABC transporter substrate-binding protein [Clostridiaceae bacterium]
MNLKKVWAFAAAMLLISATAIFAGCGKNSAGNASGTSGSIIILGSTALQPLAEQTAKDYIANNPKASINVQGGGSGAGINQVYSGSAQIGMSDVTAIEKLKDEATAKVLVDHKVCIIGFAVVTSKDIKINTLTKVQIQDIFTGKITNWKDLGGDDQQINVINRTKSSGTRAAFLNTVMDKIEENENLGTVQDSSGAVRTAVKANKGSISYLALSYLTGDVKSELNIIKIDEIEASKDNIVTKKYPFWSFEHMYTKGEASGLTKAFIDYMVSDKNKSAVEKLGYIPISDVK